MQHLLEAAAQGAQPSGSEQETPGSGASAPWGSGEVVGLSGWKDFAEDVRGQESLVGGVSSLKLNGGEAGRGRGSGPGPRSAWGLRPEGGAARPAGTTCPPQLEQVSTTGTAQGPPPGPWPGSHSPAIEAAPGQAGCGCGDSLCSCPSLCHLTCSPHSAGPLPHPATPGGLTVRQTGNASSLHSALPILGCRHAGRALSLPRPQHPC